MRYNDSLPENKVNFHELSAKLRVLWYSNVMQNVAFQIRNVIAN